MSNLLSPAQAAEKLNVNVWTIRRRIKDGSIPAAKLSRKVIRISEDALNKYIEQHRV